MDTIFEDEDIWVYNKPSGRPILKDRTGVPDLWTELKLGDKPYLVHRLDKGTSGVWVVAKNADKQAELTRHFNRRDVSKYYCALVDGRLPGGTRHIDLPLTRGRKSRYRIAGQRSEISFAHGRYQVVQDRPGLDALTSIRRLSQADGRTLILAHPHTGRTHQIRVHLAWLGLPIVGDELYNPASRQVRSDQPAARSAKSRLLLHAHYLRLPGLPPFRAALPERFRI